MRRMRRRPCASSRPRTAARYELTTGSIDYYPNLPGATRGSRAHTPRSFDGRRLGSQFNRLRPPLATTLIFGGMSVMGPDLPHFYRVGRSLRSTLIVARLLARYAADRLRGFSRGTHIGGGNGVIAALMLALNDLGVQVVTSALATGLRVDHGRVVGVEVRSEHRRRARYGNGHAERGSRRRARERRFPAQSPTHCSALHPCGSRANHMSHSRQSTIRAMGSAWRGPSGLRSTVNSWHRLRGHPYPWCRRRPAWSRYRILAIAPSPVSSRSIGAEIDSTMKRFRTTISFRPWSRLAPRIPTSRCT